MRRLTAIFFLTLFLFNLVGYRWWFSYAQKLSDNSLQHSLDNAEYDQDRIITFCIPLSSPYSNNSKSFQRADGEIELDGRIYRLVESRVSDNHLYVRCLPNDLKTSLRAAGEDYFKSVNDLGDTPASRKQGSGSDHSLRLIQGEYDDQCPGWQCGLWSTTPETPLLPHPSRLSAGISLIPEQPPRTGKA